MKREGVHRLHVVDHDDFPFEVGASRRGRKLTPANDRNGRILSEEASHAPIANRHLGLHHGRRASETDFELDQY